MNTAALPHDEQLQARFGELKPALTAQAAVIEADRCLNCFDAPCTAACPTHIDVPGFIKRIASGNLRGSALRILDANILGASCARVCPVDVLCEGACVMTRQNRKPIQIGLLQRRAMDAFWASGEAVPTSAPGTRKLRVACIGGGPASLACAAELCRNGARATVIERRMLPGGLNTYGVAEYKLRAADSVREVEMIRRLGVEFRCGVEVDSAAALEALEAEFDVIFLGLGLGAMQRLNIPGEDGRGEKGPGEDLPGEDAKGVMNALELIAAYKTGHLRELQGTVVVVGAGNTAIDAANAARRLGAEKVYMLYRRGESEMSAFEFEYEHAKQEGVQFLWHSQPVAIQRDERGRLLLETVQVRQASGKLEAVPDSQASIACDLVVPAIGQSPLMELLKQMRGIEMRDGKIVTDRQTGQTGNSRYFAGGDCVNGGREVVDAVAGGKRAALAMLKVAEVARA